MYTIIASATHPQISPPVGCGMLRVRSHVPLTLYPAKMSSEIPTEILHDIFHLLCDQPIALHDLNNKSHFHEFPWAVGQVCRHWRGAFLSHTLLWTSFALKPGNFRSAHFVEMNRRAALYLERSGQQLLTIDVSMPCSGTQTFSKKIWGMLLSCMRRWKKADLKLGGGAKLVLDGLLRYRGCMSSLESLRMSIPDFLAQARHYNAFQIAPHLTELDLSHPGYVATWQFPWAQLTRLKLEILRGEFDKGSNNPWGVLFQLENIEELHIIISSIGVPRRRSPLPITRLPSLRLLEISLVFAMMFSWFTAPSLEHLHIHGCAEFCYNWLHDEQPNEREITSLIQRSSCHIRRLILDDFRAKEMRILMKALASVEELAITYPMRTLDVIQDITGLEGCIYMPKMRVLQVRTHIVYEVEKTVTGISRFLEVRGKESSLPSHNIVPLEKFVIWLTFKLFPDEVLEVMRSWPSFVQVYINGSVLERLTPSL
ncbi:hypothetical protein F5887DRAFT_428652 [Amanita rubescens]|nr:hypothetical protein F5887DRAFT_428652 [Amanita rubescens]